MRLLVVTALHPDAHWLGKSLLAAGARFSQAANRMELGALKVHFTCTVCPFRMAGLEFDKILVDDYTKLSRNEKVFVSLRERPTL